MEGKQLIILAVVGFSLGGFFEFIKSPVSKPVHLHNLAKLENLLDEGKVVYDPNAGDDKAPRELSRPSRFTPPPAPPMPTLAMNDAPAAAAPGASPSPKPTPVDPKKKAEEDKKKAEEKKKKEKEEAKKKEEQAKADADAANKTEPEASPTPSASADSNAPAAQPAPASAPAPAYNYSAATNTVTSANSKSAAEWEAELMKTPDSSKTKEFVAEYKAGHVSNAVYYQVVAAMLNDNLATVQEQGISALTSTPSAQSFTLLADLESKSSDTTVKNQAETALQAYSGSKYLGYLNSVITGSDSTAALAAIQTVETAASSSQTATATSTSGTTTSTGTVSTQTYVSLQTSLQTAETRSSNSSVRSAAQQALSSLQSVLSQSEVSLNN